MEETKLICGSCNVNIADTEEAYIEKIDRQNGYCEEQDYINSPDED